jgi:hypothetical protein
MGCDSNLFEDIFDGATQYHQRQEARDFAAFPRKERNQFLYSRKANTKNGHAKLFSGDERIALLRKTLKSFGLEWSPFQMELIDQMTRICIPQLVPDLAIHGARIMRENNWPDLRTFLLVTTARRMGKSYALCAFCVAFAVACPNAVISMYTTGSRLSKANLRFMKSLLKIIYEKSGGDVAHLYEANMETLSFVGSDGTVKRISAYPSNSERLR